MRTEHHAVRAALPQRHPLLLVDRVLDLVPGERIHTVKAVTGTEGCYANLPDGAASWRYRYPLSLLVESLGQSAALLWLHDRGHDPDDGATLMFAGARSWSFDGFAYPGDVLHHHVRLTSVVADTAFASGETWVGDRRIAHVDTVIAARRPVRGDVAAPPVPSK
ncbi:3-hydroxyacyl-ACP dehydratase FabZ family protein [Dactylosporangium sp. CS-033363]|uniref:3-hydroxyacyl-ACP dehydratase FabZ family protein n=1 Tax=Dactylosporangium sp. CS-033363 TaxID=3239935 RepID=UPI003D942CA3